MTRYIDEQERTSFGARKLWRQLRCEGTTVGRDRVARLMGRLGLDTASGAGGVRTTVPA